MRSFLPACALTAAMMTAPTVLAADLVMEVPEPVLAPEPAYDWTGTYAGIQAGYGWGTDVANEYNFPSGFFSSGPFEYATSGFLIGAHLGHNRQRDHLVYGVEADIEYADVGGRVEMAGLTGFTGLTKDYNWLGSLRARLGYADDRWLAYATGGLAVASIGMSVVDNDTTVISGDETVYGWTAGLGAQYALDRDWSVRAEYRYSDFGETSISGTAFGDDYTYTHTNRLHAVRFGFSRSF